MNTYEAPTITEIGSVAEFTQADWFGDRADSLTWLIPILGEDRPRS